MTTANPALMSPGYPIDKITGVILAGGRARRMGGDDKGLIQLKGCPMVEYVIRALQPQVSTLLINANRNLKEYQALVKLPIVPDLFSEYAGPLAGMASGMQAARTKYILTAPCDAPLLTPCLGVLLYRALMQQQRRLSVATDGSRMQPVFALLPCDLLPDLMAFLRRGERKASLWFEQHDPALADLSKASDTFLNINFRTDIDSIERKLYERSAGRLMRIHNSPSGRTRQGL